MADKEIGDLTSGGAVQSGDKAHVVRGPNSRAVAFGSAAALEADTDTTLAANSDTRIATQKAVKAAIAAAIAGLLDSAPGTLDTLNELAAALGDDPDFATTVAGALAGKLAIANDLSDLHSAATALDNLGLTTVGKAVATAANAGTARTALGLGTAATANVTVSTADPSGGANGDIWFKADS